MIDNHENPFEMDELILADNEEQMEEDHAQVKSSDLIVYSRDWTVETVISQIKKKNIDLDPEFQRRNAWSDTKKSQLIESYFLGYPVPEIVLAEHPRHRKKYIVIDGKQRLLTLCGFVAPDLYNTWNNPRLSGMRDLKKLNQLTCQQISEDSSLSDYIRLLANADIRTTVISNVKDEAILYDIFYRLNAGATPLSVQELRQVLYRGDFTKFMVKYTETLTNIHRILKLTEPDNRLKDIEILTRNLAFNFNDTDYKGNLKRFLDEFTDRMNKDWASFEGKIKQRLHDIDEASAILADLCGDFHNVGRKYSDGKFETRFNTVLFEVQLFFALRSKSLASAKPEAYQDFLKQLFSDTEFVDSISSSTKNISEYKNRFSIFGELFFNEFNEEIKHPWN